MHSVTFIERFVVMNKILFITTFSLTSLNLIVIKTLSETEKTNFLEQFLMIKFDCYYVGDTMSVKGDAVKITYQNGDYEPKRILINFLAAFYNKCIA